MPRFALWRDEGPAKAGGGEGRTLGDPPTAGRTEHRFRALREPVGFGQQARGRKKPRRHAEHRGERVNAGLGEL